MKEYKRAVRFEVKGTAGRVDKNDWVLFGTCGFHLEDVSIESPVRQAIHKVRNGEWREPIKPIVTA